MGDVAQREGEAEGERAGGEHAERPKIDEDRDEKVAHRHSNRIERCGHAEPEDVALFHRITLVHHCAR